jgi:hypothetical protein
MKKKMPELLVSAFLYIKMKKQMPELIVPVFLQVKMKKKYQNQ